MGLNHREGIYLLRGLNLVQSLECASGLEMEYGHVAVFFFSEI